MPLPYHYRGGMPSDRISERILLQAMLADGTARRLRLAAGLRLADVAEVCGVNASCVSRWESGRRRPRSGHADAYAAVLADLLETVGSRG